MVTPCTCRVFDSKDKLNKQKVSLLPKVCKISLVPEYKFLENTIFHLQECYCMRDREQSFTDAVFIGNIKQLTQILKQHPEYANVLDSNGDSALHIISERGDSKMLEYLLETKLFNVNIINSRGLTPLALAVETGNESCVNILLNNGANPNITDYNGTTPLHRSARNSSLEISADLIKHDAQVNKSDVFGNTPLSIACLEKPLVPLVKLLLSNGADPSLTNDRLNCFMELILDCTTKDKLEIVKVLLESGADPNQKEVYSEKSCLHLAALNGFLPLCELLVDHGADPNVIDINGKNPYDTAKIHDNREVANFLKDHLKRQKSLRDFKSLTPQIGRAHV